MNPEITLAVSASLSAGSFILMLCAVLHMRTCWTTDRAQIDANFAHLAGAIAQLQKRAQSAHKNKRKNKRTEVRKIVGNPRKHGQHRAARKGAKSSARSARKSAHLHTQKKGS